MHCVMFGCYFKCATQLCNLQRFFYPYCCMLQCPIVIAPGLVYNVQQYSGMMCQFLCELKKKRRQSGLDVIAAGGRYDSMLSTYR